MLRSLHIENIAVIRQMDLAFTEGLSVLTGETGAGKSVLIDSIGFLLGGRVGRELIRSGARQASVSAMFADIGVTAERVAREYGIETPDGELLLERTLTPDGKTSARINARPVTQAMLRELGAALVTVHGQHDSLRLVREGEQLALVDAQAGISLDAYREAYSALTAVRRKREQLLTDEAERLRLLEILRFQIADIDSKKLRPGEEDTLLAERDKLRSLETIVKQVTLVCRILSDNEQGNVTQLLSRAASAMKHLESVIPEASEIRERLTELQYEATDLAERVRDFVPEVEGDPTVRLDKIEGRLETISRLKKKYGGSSEEVLAFRQTAAERLAGLEHSDELLSELSEEEARLEQRALDEAKKLTASRERAAEEIARKVVNALEFLDMPKVRFEISVQTGSLSETGADRIEFLLSANVGEPLQPLSKIASGGELSRIMLALSSVLRASVGASTVIYDEIDTGISGSTSRKVGISLKRASSDVQTLCVTHSAQISSLADSHFFLTKSEVDGRTETSVKLLEGEERVREVARILGGIRVTDAQRAAAVDMIEEGKSL